MSIYATILSIEDERQVQATMREAGIDYGVINDDGEVADLSDLPDMIDAPIVYQGSHVLPSDNDPRAGSVDLAEIPDHITRDGRDDAPEGSLKDWLRLSVAAPPTPRGDGGDATVILTRGQVERLHGALGDWLEREPIREES